MSYPTPQPPHATATQPTPRPIKAKYLKISFILWLCAVTVSILSIITGIIWYALTSAIYIYAALTIVLAPIYAATIYIPLAAISLGFAIKSLQRKENRTPQATLLIIANSLPILITILGIIIFTLSTLTN